MEHPLRVEEFSPSEPPLSAAIEPAVAEAPLAAAASAPLPALPNLPSSDVLFLRPSDPHYADYQAIEPSSPRVLQDRTRRGNHG